MLEGLKVVELASMVAAPAAVGLLADWGAQVIKIEAHAGDPMRGRGGSPLGSINFDLHNRGKRSIALNTSAPQTREVILKLVKDADLFVTNMLPEQITKLNLDYETLHAINPRMVYGAVSSFGRTGPEQNRGATDNLGFWARGGGTALITVEGQDPVPARQSVGDRITGLAACAGMLAAVVEAQRTGRGGFVDTSLMATGIWCFSTDIANQLNKGRTAPNKPRSGAVFPLSNYFKSKDGRWMQIMGDVPRIAAATDRPDLAADPRFSGLRTPREHHAALVAAVDAIFADFTYDELKPRLDAADVVADPQVLATDRLIEIDGEDGRHWQVAGPWTAAGENGPRAPTYGPVPGVGQHTVEVLTELGYSPAQVAEMRESGAILPA